MKNLMHMASLALGSMVNLGNALKPAKKPYVRTIGEGQVRAHRRLRAKQEANEAIPARTGNPSRQVLRAMERRRRKKNRSNMKEQVRGTKLASQLVGYDWRNAVVSVGS